MVRANKPFKSTLAIGLSWCLLSAPLAALPRPAVAQSATGESAESDFSRATRLVADLEILLDRAVYPNVPRRGLSGPPGDAELADAQSRLLTLKNDLQNTFHDRLLGVTDENTEERMAGELNTYFEAVKRFEGLKILLGRDGSPDAWDTLYAVKIPLKDLSQMKFIETASFFAVNFAALPVQGYDGDALARQAGQKAAFFTHLDGEAGRWWLSFRLNPNFAGDFERLRLLSHPGLKSGLLFAAHFSAHRLYDSLALTQALLRQLPEQMPKPTDGLSARFLSLRLARAEQVRRFATAAAEKQKPLLFKALLDAVEKTHAQGQGWVLDDTFYSEFYRLSGQSQPPPSSNDEIAALHHDEASSFQAAIGALLNMTDAGEWPRLAEFLLGQGKRLSLRWMFLANAEVIGALPVGARQALEKMIDIRSARFAQEVLRTGGAQAALTRILQQEKTAIFQEQRRDFEHKLVLASAKLRDFRAQPINLQYLLRAQNPSIQGLSPGPAVRATVDALGQEPDYAAGYLKYKEILFNYLKGFRFDQPLPRELTLRKLDDLQGQARWNPQALSSVVPAQYLAALDEKGRLKDLRDLLSLGHLLKFDTYETLDAAATSAAAVAPTLDNLGFDDTWLGRVWHSERKAYLEEVKKDLMDNSPLLGGRQPESNRPLWEDLADPSIPAARKSELIERQLRVVAGHIYDDEMSLQKDIAQIDALAEGASDTRGLGEEMRVLATRASQITVGLESFASFNSYYQALRSQLLLPGFLRNEWQQFATWSNTAVGFMIGFMVIQMIGARFAPVGRLTDMAGKFLAPVFGPNFSRIQGFFWGLVGVSLSDQVYRGWVSEPARLDILRRYFECGSGGPCVALYSDVKNQTDIMNAPRTEALTSVLVLAVVIGAFRAARGAVNLYAYFRSANTLPPLKADLATLGLAETAPLDRRNLQAALEDTLRRAQNESDPIAAALGEVYARQAYFRIESRVWKEASRWTGFDARFKSDFKKLGIDARNWKDINSLAGALQRLEDRRAQGLIMNSEYQELKSTLVAAYQKLQPTWSRMDKSPLLRNFYERVWDTAAGVSDTQIAASRGFFDRRIAARFTRAMDEFYGDTIRRPAFIDGRLVWRRPVARSTDRLDKMMSRIVREIELNPELSQARLGQLEQMLVKEVLP